ncbi:MAG: response regulator transcription factor [Mycobacterium sp.]
MPSAYEFARTGDFHLLVLDIGLPGLDGFGVSAKLRSEGSPIPVIMLTARTRVADTVAALEGEADDYMTWPKRFRLPGQVLSREQLLSQVRGYDYDPGSNVVDVYVRYLRRNLGRLVTLRGMGYRLEAVP